MDGLSRWWRDRRRKNIRARSRKRRRVMVRSFNWICFQCGSRLPVMAKKKQDERPDPADMTYEQAIAELEAINERIEQGTIGLEESLAEYRRGVALAKRCTQILDAAEQEIQHIKAGDDAPKST